MPQKLRPPRFDHSEETKRGSADKVTLDVKVVVDGGVGGEKPLG
jgi:hypothetical protein